MQTRKETELKSIFHNQIEHKLPAFLGLVAAGFVFAAVPTHAQINEQHYANVRGWTVNAFFDNRTFQGCAGINPDNGGAMRIALTRDNAWGVSLRANGNGFINGNLEIDGRNQPVQYQYSPEGWANVGLTAQELVDIRRGRSIGIDIGRGYFDFSLAGSTAAMGKVTECVNRQGRKPQPRVAQQQPRRQQPPTVQPPTQQKPKRVTSNNCRNGEQFLPISGLCTNEARRLLVIANGTNSLEPQYMPPGCSVAVNETEWFLDVLLYKAQRCNGVTAKYNFERGPHRGITGVLTGQIPSVTAFGLTDIGGKSDAKTNIEYRARQEMGAEHGDKNKCFVFSGEGFGHPQGSLVFNDMDAGATNAICARQTDGPCDVGSCGKLGFFGDSTGYWRVFGSHAWFFDFGQETPQIEARTMTLITKDGKGGWRVGSQFD